MMNVVAPKNWLDARLIVYWYALVTKAKAAPANIAGRLKDVIIMPPLENVIRDGEEAPNVEVV